MYTQASVVAPVIDYVILALKGKGKIVVGDAPMQSCDFSYLEETSGYKSMIDYYKQHGVDIELVDLRDLVTVIKNGVRHQNINEKSQGTVVNLGKNSEFALLSTSELKKMRITCYDPRILYQHHNEKVHEYYVSDYLLNSNVIINMPKPKCHRKAGVTISLKNLVGINTRKEFLPHHRKGAKSTTSDEYQNKSLVHKTQGFLLDYQNIAIAERRFKLAKLISYPLRGCYFLLHHFSKDHTSEGSWYGNDTISRTILDLNKIVLYADKDGIMHEKAIRKTLIVADMIVSGEKEGPLLPSRKEVGYIAVGTNNVCFDETISAFMGFDPKKIPTIARARHMHGCYHIVDESEPIIVSNVQGLNNTSPHEIPKEFMQNFEPSSGWRNHIEFYQ